MLSYAHQKLNVDLSHIYYFAFANWIWFIGRYTHLRLESLNNCHMTHATIVNVDMPWCMGMTISYMKTNGLDVYNL